MKQRHAAVFVQERRAGTLRQEPGRFVFEYDSGYLADTAAPAVSLTLPKTQQVYVSPTLFPFFAGLLAEGTNLSLQARTYHLDERDDFGLLVATATQQTIGAVTVRPMPR
ncbi:MAG: phosphatidylinositol kinase [Hymenobacter sp.]|nr:MAG: phosphatidylinositol kinase [Hymenobacter sp.]